MSERYWDVLNWYGRSSFTANVSQRNRDIRRMHSAGETHRAIAAVFGISPQRVSQIVRNIHG